MSDPLPPKNPSPQACGAHAPAPAPVVASLFSISKTTRAFVALLLADIGLHAGQDQLLERLEFGEAVSVSVLAEKLAVRPSTVSKMLDRLIEKGFVLRVGSNGDARRTMVVLTPAGEEMRAGIRAVWQRLEDELTGGLTQDERRVLADTLARADDILAVRLRRLR